MKIKNVQRTKPMQKPNNSVIAKTQSDIATQIGISVDTLQNCKLLADMIPELEELVDIWREKFVLNDN